MPFRTNFSTLIFSAIYFDGKESDSRRFVDGKHKFVKEETHTVVAYPGEQTLGIVKIDDKSGSYSHIKDNTSFSLMFKIASFPSS